VGVKAVVGGGFLKILVIETSTPASSVALGDAGSVVAAAERVDRTGHAGFIVTAMDFCFDQAGWGPQDLDVVAVDVGPGLYTGIRVGISTAQGLGAALGVPLLAVSSLDGLALGAATGRRHIVAVVDVRRRQFAVASYRPVPGGVVREGPAQLMDADRLRALLESDPDDVLVVGDTPQIPDEVFRGLHRVKKGRPRYPAAGVLIGLVEPVAQREDFVLPDEIRPMYLREPDVAINWAVLRQEGPWPQSP
jgi:tRNA threonylcarbamoyladenosine biosynthesis protein TsaB